MAFTPPDFDQVFTSYAGFAWRVLARYGVPERELEDACQDVFLVVHKQLPSFEGRASLKTWIYSICRRVASNHRQRAVHVHERLAEPSDLTIRVEDADALELLERKQSLALLDALLAQLSPEQRDVFVLYEIGEASMREVSESLGCSQNTAYSRLQAARARIAATLQRLRAKRSVA